MYKEVYYGIHIVMRALKQLYEEQHLVESNHSKECIENLYRSADSVKAFTDDMLCHKKNEKMKRSDVYKMYEDYCEENGRTPSWKIPVLEIYGRQGI